MPRGRSKSRKNRKGNEEPQVVSSLEREEVASGGNKKKSTPKDGPDSPGRGCGKLKHLQEPGEPTPHNDSSTGLVKEDASPKKTSNSGRESDNNSAIGDEKSNVAPRRKKGRRKSQEVNLNESRDKDFQLMLFEEILKEQAEEEKIQPQKQKKNKNEKVEELDEILEESKKEKKVNKESFETESNADSLDSKKKPGSEMANNCSLSKNTSDEKSEKDQNVDKDSVRATEIITPSNTKDEKKEDATSKIQENWLTVSSKRQHKKRSQERNDNSNISNEARINKQELSEKNPEPDERNNSNVSDEQGSREMKVSPGSTMATSTKPNDDTSLTKMCERKLSVHEIKQRFSMEKTKDKDSNISKTLQGPTEAGDDKVDSIPVRKSSKEKLFPGSEGELVPSSTNNTTTELFVSSVGDKESMSSSSLFRAESPTEIIAEDGTVNLKPKVLHGGITSNIGKTLIAIDKDGSVFARCSYEPPKISVKQLRERLISSCSKLNDKLGEDKTFDTESKDDDRTSSDEIVIDKHTKGHEKKDYNISLKERLESYRCQATKEFQVPQTSTFEQDIPAGTSIKELQSSFDKMHQPNNNPTTDNTKNKAKTVNEEIHHAQEYTMKCKACGKQVFLMERVMAEKSIWHKTCFRCSKCRKQLTVENYKSHDGVLYCEQHYDQILKPKRAEGAVSAHTTSTPVEEVNISPLSVKSLFEKNGSSTIDSNTSSTVFAPVEKSPKFLKRLRRFEKKMSENSEEDSEKQKGFDTLSQKSNPEKSSKSTKDELESSTELENDDDDGGKSVKSAKDSESSKKSTPSNSPRGKGKTLHGHLKQIFEKHENEQNTQPCVQTNRKDKKSTGSKKSKGGIVERLQICDVPKKPGTGQTNSDDGNSPELNEKNAKCLTEDNETNKFRNATKEIDLGDLKESKGQSRDVHSVISYFNQQQ